MSRLGQAREAVRPALLARALFSGPPGAGKTRSALIVGEVLAEGGKVLVIDTEKESALTYADDFTFTHLAWQPPFDPRELAGTVTDAGNTYDVVVIDSMSHFWRGDGGTLDIAGGKFTGWKDARPAQIDLVEAILGCRAHVIVCARAKVEHVQEKEGGKHVVRKLGMSVVQDDDLEYELNVALEFDMDHSATVSKSRTVAVPVGRVFKAGHAEDFAALYRDWLKGGEPPAPAAAVDGLVARLNALPTEAERVSAKQEFLAQLGRPEHLRESQLAEAEALVAKHEGGDGDGSGAGAPPVDEPTPDSGGAAETSGPDGRGVAGGDTRETDGNEPVRAASEAAAGAEDPAAAERGHPENVEAGAGPSQGAEGAPASDADGVPPGAPSTDTEPAAAGPEGGESDALSEQAGAAESPGGPDAPATAPPSDGVDVQDLEDLVKDRRGFKREASRRAALLAKAQELAGSLDVDPPATWEDLSLTGQLLDETFQYYDLLVKAEARRAAKSDTQVAREALICRISEDMPALSKDQHDEVRHVLMRHVTNGRTQSSADATLDELMAARELVADSVRNRGDLTVARRANGGFEVRPRQGAKAGAAA